ncbi:MAG: hypothetical protein WKG01_24190 [Kofleriaceae bacterium]
MLDFQAPLRARKLATRDQTPHGGLSRVHWWVPQPFAVASATRQVDLAIVDDQNSRLPRSVVVLPEVEFCCDLSSHGSRVGLSIVTDAWRLIAWADPHRQRELALARPFEQAAGIERGGRKLDHQRLAVVSRATARTEPGEDRLNGARKCPASARLDQMRIQHRLDIGSTPGIGESDRDRPDRLGWRREPDRDLGSTSAASRSQVTSRDLSPALTTSIS